jgi:hypothetical protein
MLPPRPLLTSTACRADPGAAATRSQGNVAMGVTIYDTKLRIKHLDLYPSGIFCHMNIHPGTNILLSCGE